MSPTSPDNQGAFELPQPQAGEATTPLPSAEAAPVQSEQQSKQAELPGSSLPPVLTPPPTAAQPPLPPAPAPGTAAPTPQTGATSPAIADDVDLIEKEWVDKAKAIVDRTREDPHQQNKQLNEFKADYMKKRYGKEVRLTDE